MKNKIIAITIVLVILIGAVTGYKHFFAKEELSYDFFVVQKGDIVQEVSTTGTVTPTKKIEPQFKTTGKIKEILVKVGDSVKTGQALVKLNSSNLYIQKDQALASLELYQAKLNQLLAGEKPEQIEVYETAVENAQKSVKDAKISLVNAKQNLADVEALTEIELSQACEDGLDALNTSYTAADKALLRVLKDIRETYFNSNDQVATEVKEKEKDAILCFDSAKNYVDAANNEQSQENLGIALIELKSALNKIKETLTKARQAMDEPRYKSAVLAADETKIDTERTNIDTALTNITNSRQTISLTELTGQSNINTAQTKVDTAQSALNSTQAELKKAETNLVLIKAEPRATDIALYEAQIKEAKANLALVEKEISETVLRAPTNGTITAVYGEIGERANINNPVLAMISEGKFQIEADIPEADIGKVDLTQTVKITLDAFPEHEFFGKVIEIEPAETIISGVVYYKTTVEFDETDDEFFDRVKSGMTANITIITDSRKNVLIIPQRAVKEKQGKKIVRVPSVNGDVFQEIEIKTGLRGSNGMIEIISGLNEGDKAITFVREK